MKTPTVIRNGVTPQVIELVGRLVDMIPWPVRRSAMGDVIISLLDGKSRVAEDVFGWNRSTTELGMNEFRTKILCINDLSNRRKPKAEEKYPKLLADIVEIMEPHSQSESRLRTTLLYTNMTAKAVYKALLLKGWSEEALPTLQTISNILNRHGYRLRAVENTKVKKNARDRHYLRKCPGNEYVGRWGYGNFEDKHRYKSDRQYRRIFKTRSFARS